MVQLMGRKRGVFGAAGRTWTVPSVQYTRELFTLSDAGEVALDWTVSSPHASVCVPRDVPIVLVQHGLNGGSDSPYIR